jgi:hypothetical protein
MKLSEKQQIFAVNFAYLILHAKVLGYAVTLGDAYRDPRVFGQMGEDKGYGRPESNHKQRLAADINLFKDGKWLQNTEDHRPLGEYWETLHQDNVWGGRFDDGNHYSMKHQGNM